jgi:hypothetical protein
MAESSTSELPPPNSPLRPKVIYVMGAGRSGSTILGVALGNCAGFFYAGELDKWLLRSGVPQIGGSERTRFWNGVRVEVKDADDLFGEETHRCLERSSALFRIHHWRARRRLRRRYGPIAEELYRAIAHAAGATHVVDSSHLPLRARELQRLGAIELYLVFLVRNPHRVIASLNEDVNRYDVVKRWFRLLTANAELSLTHLLSVFVFLRQRRDHRLLLRHEDFVADPAGVLRDILDRVDSAAGIPDMSSLSTGLPFQGNRLIRSGVVALKPDSAAPLRPSRMTTLVQLPWAAILSGLQPAVTASASPEHASASESH